MKTSNFKQSINRKNSSSVKWDLIEMNHYPEETIPLWVADMDFKTDPHVVEALQAQLDHGIFGYHLPIEGYHQAVLDWCLKRHHADLSQATMINTHGVVNGIATSIVALTNPKDHVLILEPVYHPFKRLILDNDRMVSISNLLLNDGYYQMNLKEIELLIQKDKVKMLIFCSPHNPVGRVWKKDELVSLMEICLKHHVIVLSDEIHMDFVYPIQTHHMLVTLDPRYEAYVLTFISASKTFNLADSKIAQLFVYNQEYSKKIKEVYDRLGMSSVSGWSQVAQKAAYKYGDEFADELMEMIVFNKELVENKLKQAKSQIKIIQPEGLYLLWLDFRAFKKDPKQIMDQLLYQAKVWLNDGSSFGDSGSGFFRMNIATTPDIVEEAITRIISVFDAPTV